MRRLLNGLAISSKIQWRKQCSLTALRPLPSQRRPLSTAFSSARPDTVQVLVGSSGSIALDIYHAPRPTLRHPTIIYLPRGPLGSKAVQVDWPSHDVLSSLAAKANATVVKLNYRFSTEKHRYPAPLHDTLAGYDWVVKHLATSPAVLDTPRLSARQEEQQTLGAAGSVCVCGELFGGTLAAVLAATECRSYGAGAVRAAVLGNPVTDWTAMHSIVPAGGGATKSFFDNVLNKPAAPAEPTKKKRGRKKAPMLSAWEANASNPLLSAADLLKARRELFVKPADYYDPFASPLLFFRTPANELPASAAAEEDPLEALFAEINQGQSYAALAKKRKVHKRHPPTDSGLRLPRMRVWLGEDSVLLDQGVEFARLVQRSAEMYGTKGSSEEEEEVDIRVLPELGLWSDDDVTEIGRWFGQVLWSTP